VKYVLVATAALLVGLLLGGIPTRGEVRRLETEVEELEDRECRPRLGTDFLGALRPQVESPPATAATPPGVDEPEDTDTEAAPAADEAPELDEDEGPEAMRAVLDARRAQARAALLEQVEPTDAQLDTFDAAVADMNTELRAIAEDLLARVRELGEPPPRREMLLYAADGLDAVIEADTRIREALGDVDVDDEAVDPLSHVDPALVDLLVELDEAGFDD
jgi:hypothetical protein